MYLYYADMEVNTNACCVIPSHHLMSSERTVSIYFFALVIVTQFWHINVFNVYGYYWDILAHTSVPFLIQGIG